MLLKRTQIEEWFLEKGEDIGLLTVYESISRKEFEDIKWYIRFADNNHLNTQDKFVKLENYTTFNFFHFYYFVDEQMIPYTGKNSSKQTIRTKTVRFGYKNFNTCSDDVYSYFIDSYCGFKYIGQNKTSKNLCARTVINCVSKIDDWSDKEVFFDNWFSSLSLTKVLKGQGIRAIGTFKAGRLGSLEINKSDVKKQE